MNKSILEDINLLSLTIAGFVAGYLMFIVDLALSGFLGLFGTYDIYLLHLVWGVSFALIYQEK